MKKYLIIAALLAAIVAPASFAQSVDDVVYGPFSLVTTNSDSSVYVVRGLLESVHIDNAASKTSVVLVTTSQGTVFSLTSTADGLYYPRVPAHTTTGGNASNSTQFVQWEKIALSGAATVRVAGAADTTGTNSTTVTLNVSK